TYTVQVNKPDTGDHVLTNYLVPTGTNPPGSCLASNPNCATNPVADISLVKSADKTAYSAAGQTITYSYKVTNTGQSILDPVVVTDPMTGLSTITCPQTSLAVGDDETCTATYLTTAADLLAGSVNNTGTATGTPPQGAPVVATSSVSVPGSDLIVTKVSSPSSTNSVDPGDSVTYTLTFDNTHGTVATPAFTYTDDLSAVLDDANVTTAPALATGTGLTVGSISTSGSTSTFSITGTVAPGATATVTYTVKVNKPDTGDHVLTNYLVPTGTNPPGTCLASNPDCTTNPVADIALVKTGSIASFTAAGTQVTYSYKVTNTGQSLLDPVVVTDPMTGLSAITCPQTSLAPGATETCTATYTTTAADLSSGAIRNTGTATGTPPQGAPVVATSSLLIPGLAPGQQPQVTTTTTVAKKALAFTGMRVTQLLTLAGVLIAWGLVVVGIGYSRRRPAPSGSRRRR
ncbi:MAG TPA: hypothetical protein VFH56_10375, partial [Acidimicrobiales bacterium]|nr:hypothetical protein [Acidimicrobiales bacterium]